MKEIKLVDVLRFYIGSRCRLNVYGVDYYGWFRGMNANEFFVQVDGDRAEKNHRDFTKLTLQLKSLSYMTEEEKKGLLKICYEVSSDNILPVIPSGRHLNLYHSRRSDEVTRYLLSKSFDLFNLIPTSQAIELKD